MRRLALALLTTGVIGSASAAHAAPVTIDFSGVITSTPFFDFYGLGFNVGDGYSASFTYDTLAPGTYQGGGYTTYPILGASFTDGSTTINFDPAADSQMGIMNNEYDGDSVLVDARTDNGLILAFNASAPWNSVFSDSSLPASIDLGAFAVTATLEEGEAGSFDLAVPEPASMLVLGTGILGLGLVRCRC